MSGKIKTNKNNDIKSKYRFVVLNDSTFEEKFSLILSRTNVWVFLSTLAVILMVITASAIVYTPLKYLIPGFGDYNNRGQIIDLALRTDSLEAVMRAREIKIGNVEGIFTNKIDSVQLQSKSETSPEVEKIVNPAAASKQEINLRKEVDEIESFAIHNSKNKKDVNSQLSEYHFISPVSGIPTDEYNSSTEHYGIDIAAKRGEPVKTILDGTVIYTGYDTETGYTIAVQHKENLISIYKHNASLLKNNGNVLKAGDVIATVGNTGTLSSGPHLHFELWYNGSALNPKEFILF